jgi:hypothetical protein
VKSLGAQRWLTRAAWWLLTAGLGLGAVGGAAAQEMTIDHRQVATLMRALAYDQRLVARAGADIHVGVLSKAAAPASGRASDAITLAFQSVNGASVQGLPVRTSQVAFTDVDVLATAIERRSIDVLYICPGLEAEVPAIVELTRKRHVLSIGSREEHVTRGAALGVFTVEGSPTVFVNLEGSRKEGVLFAGAMLRLARVIR